MSKIIFQIEGGAPVTIEANPGDNLLELARRANVAIDAPCSGNGSCGKCRVKLVSGEVDSLKSRHISEEEWEAGWRLSCNTKVVGDAEVFVPDIASAYQSRMKTADLSTGKEVAIFEEMQANLKAAGVEFFNDFMALDLQMDEPTLEDTMPDIERLIWAVKSQIEVEEVHVPFAVMSRMAEVLREHNFHVCVKGQHKGDKFECMEICAPEDTALVGCAIDIGTTTVTMVLIDLETGKILAKGSSGNGQIRYGADVINRIIEQGRPGGKKKLQDAIIKETLNPIIANLCKSIGISARSILRLCIGSNTTMNHLLLGVDANPVRMEPYIPSFFGWEGLLAGDLKLPAHPLAPVSIAPNIGSYVGGDITAGTALLDDAVDDVGTEADLTVAGGTLCQDLTGLHVHKDHGDGGGADVDGAANDLGLVGGADVHADELAKTQFALDADMEIVFAQDLCHLHHDGVGDLHLTVGHLLFDRPDQTLDVGHGVVGAGRSHFHIQCHKVVIKNDAAGLQIILGILKNGDLLGGGQVGGLHAGLVGGGNVGHQHGAVAHHLGVAAEPPARGKFLVGDMTAADGVQFALDELDTALAAGAVAGAGCVDGHIGTAGQFQQIITGVAFNDNRAAALNLEGYFHRVVLS